MSPGRALQQLPGDAGAWPRGLSRVAAIIDLEPDELARRVGIRFFDGHDELDFFRAALLEVHGAPCALIRHLRSPTPGTEVWVPEGAPESERHVRRVLEALGLSEDVIRWELDASVA